jgi:hypothetical protein
MTRAGLLKRRAPHPNRVVGAKPGSPPAKPGLSGTRIHRDRQFLGLIASRPTISLVERIETDNF